MKRRNLQRRAGPTRRLLREGLALTLLVFFLPAAVFAAPAGAAAEVPGTISSAVPAGEVSSAPAPETGSGKDQKTERKKETKTESKAKSRQKQAAEKEEETGQAAPQLRVKLGTKVRKMDLERYLWGVVAAEMPAAFQPEALKAQAIAARSYTLYRMAHPSPNHPGAELCSDPACCQAWISRKDRLAAWSGETREAYAQKITAAVRETRGQAVCRGDRPIMAAFHASSAGTTRSAREVWGREVSYLQAVDSPEVKGEVPKYYSVVTLSPERFRRSLLRRYPRMKLGGDPKGWIGKTVRDKGGLPVSIRLGGVTVPTAELRRLFGLRSACVTAEYRGKRICFYVTGYGHGVGMSQYGANAMAERGQKAGAILRHYYTGVKVKRLY